MIGIKISEGEAVIRFVIIPVHSFDQCFSTDGIRPGMGTWRPFYRDLEHYRN